MQYVLKGSNKLQRTPSLTWIESKSRSERCCTRHGLWSKNKAIKKLVFCLRLRVGVSVTAKSAFAPTDFFGLFYR